MREVQDTARKQTKAVRIVNGPENESARQKIGHGIDIFVEFWVSRHSARWLLLGLG